jgi:predicted TIM-barrel fold metal-dependent hydrolase
MIIDFHTHIFPSFFRKGRDLYFDKEPGFDLLYRSPKSRMAGKKDLIDNMDQEGIDRSVVFGFPWRNVDYYKRHNDYIIESVQEYPDRLIGFCCFDPMSRSTSDEVERCLDAGLKGVGELAFYYIDFAADAIDALNDIMAICLQRNTPILIHANEPVGHQYPGKQPMALNHLYDLVIKHPLNKIVLAHWGGGLFFYKLMKMDVREAIANVWFDTAASPYLYLPDIYRVAAEIIGSDRILFGSDYPLLRPGRYFKEMETTGLSPGVLINFKGMNAAAILGMNADDNFNAT